jgi:hypothetical protein
MYVTVIQQQQPRAQKSCVKYKELANGYGCIHELACMKVRIQWKLFLFVLKNGIISLVSISILLVHLLLHDKDETRLEFELRGKAWKVYWLLLKHDCPMSVRQVQRALRFSSPSVAQHHLERLCELGLVQKQTVGGCYFLVSKVKIGVLRHFVKFGRLLFPRYFFYAVFSTTLYAIYLAIFMQGFSRESLFIALFGGVVSMIFWYEAVRMWSLKPV